MTADENINPITGKTRRMPSIEYLRNQCADRLDALGEDDFSSPAFMSAMIALIDLHFAEGGTNKAPVLQLMKS
jgi:hypothetical protein